MATSQSSSEIYMLLSMMTRRLDYNNYIVWRYQFQTLLEGFDLFGYIDGLTPCPAKNVISTNEGVTYEINAAYNLWQKTDKAVLSLLLATLTDDVMDFVVGSKSSRDAWICLQDMFCSTSRANIMQLKTDILTIKKGSDTIERYLRRIKQARDKLCAVGVIHSDEDIVVLTLNGLPNEYAMLKMIIRSRETPFTVNDLRLQLLATEKEIERNERVMHYSSGVSDMSAQFLSQNSQGSKSCSRSFCENDINGMRKSSAETLTGYDRSRRIESYNNWSVVGGYNKNGRLSPVCQICRKKGHTAKSCIYRNDISPGHFRHSVVICQICCLKGHTALQCHHRFRGSCFVTQIRVPHDVVDGGEHIIANKGSADANVNGVDNVVLENESHSDISAESAEIDGGDDKCVNTGLNKVLSWESQTELKKVEEDALREEFSNSLAEKEDEIKEKTAKIEYAEQCLTTLKMELKAARSKMDSYDAEISSEKLEIKELSKKLEAANDKANSFEREKKIGNDGNSGGGNNVVVCGSGDNDGNSGGVNTVVVGGSGDNSGAYSNVVAGGREDNSGASNAFVADGSSSVLQPVVFYGNQTQVMMTSVVFFIFLGDSVVMFKYLCHGVSDVKKDIETIDGTAQDLGGSESEDGDIGAGANVVFLCLREHHVNDTCFFCCSVVFSAAGVVVLLLYVVVIMLASSDKKGLNFVDSVSPATAVVSQENGGLSTCLNASSSFCQTGTTENGAAGGINSDSNTCQKHMPDIMDADEELRALACVDDDVVIMLLGMKLIAYHVKAEKADIIHSYTTARAGYAGYVPYIKSMAHPLSMRGIGSCN